MWIKITVRVGNDANSHSLYSRMATLEGTHIYGPDDAGEHWTPITTEPRPALRIRGGDLAVPKQVPRKGNTVNRRR